MQLKELLDKIKNKKVVFVGLGNKIKKDDSVGLYIVEKLKNFLQSKNFYFIEAGIVLENYLNKIIDLAADVILFFDALRNNSEIKDEFLLLKKEQIANYTFSTHNISLATILDFISELSKQQNKPIPDCYVLAVKIEDATLGEELTQQTLCRADNIIELFRLSLTNF